MRWRSDSLHKADDRGKCSLTTALHLSFAKTDQAKNQWFREGEMLPFEMVGGETDTS
jgi:hypothetical protein